MKPETNGFSGTELLPVEEVEVEEERGLRSGMEHAGPWNEERLQVADVTPCSSQY